MIRKGPEMDVSDLKLLQTIYYILTSSYSFRRQMSVYEFRSFLIAELRKQNIRIEIIDEEHPLFSVNKKVILFFPDSKKDERQIQTILLEFLITYAKLLYCHPLARCFQAGAITIIITAAAGGMHHHHHHCHRW